MIIQENSQNSRKFSINSQSIVKILICPRFNKKTDNKACQLLLIIREAPFHRSINPATRLSLSEAILPRMHESINRSHQRWTEAFVSIASTFPQKRKNQCHRVSLCAQRSRRATLRHQKHITRYQPAFPRHARIRAG